jgi:uncharacterized protein (TIGR00159 family)
VSLLRELPGAMRLVDLVDVALVAALLWLGIAWLRTARARTALAGLLILSGVYFLARQLGLVLTASILQWFVAASVIVVVVVFQEDIRRLFERIGALGLRNRSRAEIADAVDVLTRAVARLADLRHGALIVIPGRDPLDRHVQGGIELDAHLSEPLLVSLFDPSSPGHDGAVVLSGHRVARFAAHLPLSSDWSQLGQRGTRHAAALGLAERADALCLVVSEEQGTVSAAGDGKLRTLGRPELAAEEIRGFLARLTPSETVSSSRWRRIGRRPSELATAFVVAALLWVLAVPGTGVVEVERSAPVSIVDLPAGYELQRIDPPEVRVVLAGRRLDFFLGNSAPVEVRLNTALAALGRRTFVITPQDIVHPDRIEIMAIDPGTVRLSLRDTRAPRRD